MNAGATRMANTTSTPARLTELVTVSENVPKNTSSFNVPRNRPMVHHSTVPMARYRAAVLSTALMGTKRMSAATRCCISSAPRGARDRAITAALIPKA